MSSDLPFFGERFKAEGRLRKSMSFTNSRGWIEEIDTHDKKYVRNTE